MGKTILTSHQSHFLECVCDEPSIVTHFYLTGGTALAAFYYQHRLSEDIDLFCEQEEVNQALVEAFLKKSARRLGIAHWDRKVFFGLVSYLLFYDDDSALKVDFNYYPFPRIAKGTVYKTLPVDSIYDIAVNKVHTLFMKPRMRDYIDLYCIMTRERYALDRLIADAKIKFDWHIDRPTLGSQFLRVSDFEELPTMLVPFNRKVMEDFFVRLSRSLKPEILKP